MKNNFYKHFLPSEIIDNFDLVKINELEDKEYIEMRIYLDEKLVYPDGYSDGELESRGFTKSVFISDFPIRDKKVILVIRRRKWRVKKTENLIFRDLEIRESGTMYSKEFAAFLKKNSTIMQ